jgi:hypothetical protein
MFHPLARKERNIKNNTTIAPMIRIAVWSSSMKVAGIVDKIMTKIVPYAFKSFFQSSIISLKMLLMNSRIIGPFL